MKINEIVAELVVGGKLTVNRGCIGSANSRTVSITSRETAILWPADKRGPIPIRMSQVESMMNRNRIIERPSTWWDWHGFISAPQRYEFTAADLVGLKSVLDGSTPVFGTGWAIRRSQDEVRVQ